MNPVLKQRLSFLIKLLVTAGLFWWIFDGVNLAALWSRAENFSVLAGLLCIAALTVQTVIAAFRLRLLCGFMGTGLSVRASWQYTLVGYFFNQVLPSTIGGDAVKAWLLSQRDKWTLRLALHCVVTDRALGLLALMVVIAFTMPLITETIPDKQAVTAIAFVLGVGVLGTLTFAFLPRLPAILERTRIVGELRGLRDAFRSIFGVPALYGLAGFYGISMYLLNVGVVWFVAQQVDISVNFVECLVIVPTALFISVVPISIAGWGLREGAMVAGFAYVGISATDAVFLSVTLGASMTIVGLIGGLVWMMTNAKAAPVDDAAARWC